MSSSWHHILAISPKKIEIYRVGDNRGTVNTSASPHISDQFNTVVLIYRHNISSGLH